MYPIAPLERGLGSVATLGKSSPPQSLEQRLMHAHRQGHSTNPTNAADDARQKMICALLMSQWKAQIYMPDPDDPSACPGLEINPSW
ncbi:hypothetical protein [Burkholderia ubonensis]|uniref:hypothetical protein n=1 Tax=Burkholderia ubonensis TaxID=101571 RepID=UPI0012F8859D|nr:hypothetical protein [Burkholderia ubonensis]